MTTTDYIRNLLSEALRFARYGNAAAAQALVEHVIELVEEMEEKREETA